MDDEGWLAESGSDLVFGCCYLGFPGFRSGLVGAGLWWEVVLDVSCGMIRTTRYEMRIYD